MKIKTSLVITALALTIPAMGQNPICPMGVYIADPSARVDLDGSMYIYGSLDAIPWNFCSKDYHVLSSRDLKNWTLHPYSFHHDEILYAPDMMYRDGTYHLYYDTPDGNEYVAVSNSPTGPFHDGVKIDGPTQIDPNIFIDDAGQAYYFWGQFSGKGAKMNPDMKTLDMSTFVDGLVTEKDNYFHEGSYVVKRGKYYYYIYADVSRDGRPTCLGYSMATSPLGPYEYKGVIIDNSGCDPISWNNHGSLVQFGEQWYVLYHRSTHGSMTMRKACIEPIHFNEDGTIDEVEMTTQGASGPLCALDRLDAAKACKMQGNIRIRLMEGHNDHEELGGIHGGDAAVWKYLDFGSGVRRISIRVQSKLGGKILVRADGPDGKLLGTVKVPAGKDWTVLTARIKQLSGVHALWLDFEGVHAPEIDMTSMASGDNMDWESFIARMAEPKPDEYELFSVDWLRFK